MKSLTTYINEHFVTGINKEQIQKLIDNYGDDIFSIIEYGYKDIGGCAGISKKEDILNKADFVKLYRKDGNIVAVSLYADKKHPNAGSELYLDDRTKNRGRKVVACAASEGNSEYLKKILTEDFKLVNRNVWGEFSSKAATFALRCGALPVPVEVAESIMSPKKFYDKKEDGYFYTRDIKGQKHTKVLMGNHLFFQHNIKERLSEEDIQKFKELGKKYALEDEKLNHI